MPLLLKKKINHLSSQDDDTDEDYPPPEKKAKNTNGNKSKKLPPPTPEQKAALISFMSKHKHYAVGRIPGKNANKAMQAMHVRLASVVNREKGVPRDGGKWWKCWVSLRNANKAYAAANYKRRDCRTGGGGLDDSIASTDAFDAKTDCEDIYYTDCEITNSVMKIIGWHNAVGMAGVTDDLDDTGHEITEKSSKGEDDDSESDDGDADDDKENKTERNNRLVENSKCLITSTPFAKEMKASSQRLAFASKSDFNEVSIIERSNSQMSSTSTGSSRKNELSSSSSSKKVHATSSQLCSRSSGSLLTIHGEEKTRSTTAVEDKLDIVIEELRRNTNMMSMLMQHLKANSLMVLTAPSAVGQVVTEGNGQLQNLTIISEGSDQIKYTVVENAVEITEASGNIQDDVEKTKASDKIQDVVEMPEASDNIQDVDGCVVIPDTIFEDPCDDDPQFSEIYKILGSLPVDKDTAGKRPLSMPDI